jgi:HSP20 family protein
VGFGRDPDDPRGDLLPAQLLAYSLRLVAGERLAPAPGEETDFPALDVFETPEEIVVEAELPGVDPARVEVTAGDGTIAIEGVKEEALEEERVNYLCMERSFGAFRRSVPLTQAVDFTRAGATYRAGLLQIRVPKLQEKRGRRRLVPVSVDPPAEGGGEP